MDEFVTYTLNVSEIGLSPDTVFKQIRQTDFSPENPIVSITFEIFEKLEELAAIRGGFALFSDIELSREKGAVRIQDCWMHPQAKICAAMRNAERIAVFVCTAGKGFTDYAQSCNKNGDYLSGYIADTVGSIVVEKAMDFIQSELENQMRIYNWKITNRYSPGYCNWQIDEQKQLFSLLPNTMDFISLTKSCLMLPIKSVSGIIGVGKEVRKTGYSCDICSNKACIYRKIRMNV